MYWFLMQLLFTGFSLFIISLLVHHYHFVPNFRLGNNGKPLDPVGGTVLKNYVAKIMAKIAKFKESRKIVQASDKELEMFHSPQPHPYFNESYYFNGYDIKTKARLISRLSHRGERAHISYAFLLLDIPGKGIFAYEEDEIAFVTQKCFKGSIQTAKSSYLEYDIIEPMKKWRIRFDGPMTLGCIHPFDLKSSNSHAKVNVKFELSYEAESRLFVYMKDDLEATLCKNLSQEPWGLNFIKYCLNRSDNHCHYEDFGKLEGEIEVHDAVRPKESSISKVRLDTFRDHSWDIRRWQAIDSLLILLLSFDEPIILFGHKYKFLDVTLVSMPGNIGGVARYSTGYVLPPTKQDSAPNLVLKLATSINDIGWKVRKDQTREPLEKTFVELIFCEVNNVDQEVKVTVQMDGNISRLSYWPDNGAFEVFEDSLNFLVTNVNTLQAVKAYGTRQSGFRVGDFDPSLGGVG